LLRRVNSKFTERAADFRDDNAVIVVTFAMAS
jgi:hypothetical protein